MSNTKSKDKVVFMNINDNDSKRIAKVVNSSTAKKILEFVENNPNTTESDIAKELELAVSTVHFNVDNLMKAKMIESSEYHYSEKGRQVDHLRISNKLIVFTHKKVDDSLKQKIMSLVLSICFAFVFFSSSITSYLRFAQNKVVSSIAPKMVKSVESSARSLPMDSEVAGALMDEGMNVSQDMLMNTASSNEMMAYSEPMMMETMDYSVESTHSGMIDNLVNFDFQSFILGFIVALSLVFMIYFLVKLIRQVRKK